MSFDIVTDNLSEKIVTEFKLAKWVYFGISDVAGEAILQAVDEANEFR
jgi:hypothetical protein